MNKEKMSAQGGSALGGKTKKLAYWASVTTLGIVLGVSLQFVRAWTEPTAPAPGGNVGAPINTSAIAQTKAGSLTVQGGISAPQICIGADCRTAWPTGGTSTAFTPTLGAHAVSQSYLVGDSASEGSNLYELRTTAQARYIEIAGVNKFQTRATVSLDSQFSSDYACDTGWLDSSVASCSAGEYNYYYPDGNTSIATLSPLGVNHKLLSYSYWPGDYSAFVGWDR